jgi:hypothetical protein
MHGGLLRCDGSADAAFAEMKQSAEDLATLAAFLEAHPDPTDEPGAPTTADVALLLSYDNMWLAEIQPCGRGGHPLVHVLSMYTALRRRGLSVDIVDLNALRGEADSAILDKYTLAAVPCGTIVPHGAAAALGATEHVRVLFGPTAGAKQGHGEGVTAENTAVKTCTASAQKSIDDDVNTGNNSSSSSSNNNNNDNSSSNNYNNSSNNNSSSSKSATTALDLCSVAPGLPPGRLRDDARIAPFTVLREESLPADAHIGVAWDNDDDGLETRGGSDNESALFLTDWREFWHLAPLHRAAEGSAHAPLPGVAAPGPSEYACLCGRGPHACSGRVTVHARTKACVNY